MVDDRERRGESTDSAASTSTGSARSGSTPGPSGPEVHPSDPTTKESLLAAASAYARTLDVEVDHDAIEWEVSERATRRAGACRFNAETETVTIRLTWRAYRELGWTETAATIRHELVHAWEFQHFGEAGHGPRFREKAAELDAPRHCREFVEPRLRLDCSNDDCDWSADRHRAAVTVTHPERRRCGACGSEYEVRHVESGETWTSNEGYRAARERIGDAW